jgi:hypothetical protein
MISAALHIAIAVKLHPVTFLQQGLVHLTHCSRLGYTLPE